jgi:hypothetical protein
VVLVAALSSCAGSGHTEEQPPAQTTQLVTEADESPETDGGDREPGNRAHARADHRRDRDRSEHRQDHRGPRTASRDEADENENERDENEHDEVEADEDDNEADENEADEKEA